MKPVCVYGRRKAPDSPVHVYLDTPVGYNDGIYMEPNDELNRMSVVKGSHIVHRTFRKFSDAERFYIKNAPDADTDKDTAVAFTDGSYSPLERKYSYGAYIYHSSGEYELCGKLDCKDKRYCNIAGEVEAVKQALSFCQMRNIRSVEVRYDFSGIKEWSENGGKSEIARSLRNFVRLLEISGMKIKFRKVKAHSGIRHNNKADRLSKALWEAV